MGQGHLALPLLTMPATLALVYYSGRPWRQRLWSPVGRVHYGLVTVAALLFVWWLRPWNLVGSRD